MADAEFVTVSELAKALGISDRQAARYVSRVTDTDRMMTVMGPTRVRLAAVIALREKTTRKPSISTKTTVTTDDMTVIGQSHGRHDDSHTTVTRQTNDSHAAVMSHSEVATLRENLARVSAERDGLKDRLADTQAERDAWKEQAARDSERLGEALRALQQAQDETRAVRALSARASVELIEPQGATSAAHGLQGAQNVPIQGESVPEAPMEPPTVEEAQNGQKRGFWKRLVDSFSGGG